MSLCKIVACLMLEEFGIRPIIDRDTYQHLGAHCRKCQVNSKRGPALQKEK